MKFKTAIFDMDETLVYIPYDFEHYWTKKSFESFTKKTSSDEEVIHYLSLPINDRWPCLEKLGFNSVQEYLELWLTQEALDARFESLIVYDDTTSLLDLKEKGMQLGLVTAAPRNLGEMQKNKLEQFLSTTNLFDNIVYIHKSIFPKKPNPEALDYCINQLHADKNSTF